MLANFFLVNVQVLRKAIQLCNLFNTCREKHIKSHVFLEKKKLKGGKKRNLGGRKRPTLKFSNSPALGAGSLSPPPGSPLSTGTLGGVPTRGRSWGRKRRLCPHTPAPAAGAPLSGRLLLSRSEVQTAPATLGAHLESLRWSSPPLPPQI